MNTDEADKKFFEYADEVIEQAKRRGRPTYPMEKVVLVIIFPFMFGYFLIEFYNKIYF